MNSKDQILNKLKKNKISDSNSFPSVISDKEIFKDYPENSSLVELFIENFGKLSGEIFVSKNLEEASDHLINVISSLDNQSCLTHASETILKLLECNPILADYFEILSNNNLDSTKFATHEVGLTSADFLIARTGSIVLNSLSSGGRRMSVLPPIHIVLAETKQIVPSLDDIFRSDFASNHWSYATIISGPSRTSDIEKQLVLGAHGPKRIIVILIKNI